MDYAQTVAEGEDVLSRMSTPTKEQDMALQAELDRENGDADASVYLSCPRPGCPGDVGFACESWTDGDEDGVYASPGISAMVVSVSREGNPCCSHGHILTPGEVEALECRAAAEWAMGPAGEF